MRQLKVITIPIFALLILAACADAGDEFAFMEEAGDFEQTAGAPGEARTSDAFVDSDAAGNLGTFNQLRERLIISTGSLDIVVEDTEETLRSITRLAEARGGWVVASNIFERDGHKSGDLTVRIPADHFQETVIDIKELALEVPSEYTDSQDVTEEYIDLDSRLANLEATAERVRGFLEEARNVEEALMVNRELSQLESEIEVIKGRMQYLSQSAAFSTLQVHITPDELYQPLAVGGWRPEGIARSAVEALINLFQGMASVGIWLVIFCLPLAIVIGIPAYLIGRYAYRRWRAQRVYTSRNDEEE